MKQQRTNQWALGLQLVVGLTLIVGLLSFIPRLYAQDEKIIKYPILAPCTRHDERYKKLGFLGDGPYLTGSATYLRTWPNKYHTIVNDIIEEHLQPIKANCQANSYQRMFALSDNSELKELASKLAPWEDSDDLEQLTQFDMGRVLLEYLRVYECALHEFDHKRSFDTAREIFAEGEKTDDDSDGIEDEDEAEEDDDMVLRPFFDFFQDDLSEESAERLRIIHRERSIARVTLHRALNITGAIDRLRPLEAELSCTQRMSIDFRNLTALTAETAACYPRTWNAADPLRDIAQ